MYPHRGASPPENDSPAALFFYYKVRNLYRQEKIARVWKEIAFRGKVPYNENKITENKDGDGEKMRILIAEDEKDLNELLKKRLENQKYTVDACRDGEEALDYLAVTEYDAIILDIMMPKVNGLKVLRQIRRERKSTPVLLLTAKDSIEDRVTGLDLGADDYLVKPFAFEELLARIRVMLRKSAAAEASTNVIQIADLKVDLNTHEVCRGETAIELSNKEFSILRYLCMNQGVVLSRDKIEEHIWNYDYTGASNVVDVYIRYLRRKIDDKFEPKLIHTVRGAGYVLREEK